jgi:Uma2 family endonuclease
VRADRFAKRHLYQEAGVPLYWIVDGEERLVEVWTPETPFPHVERDRLRWEPAGAEQPFTLALAELFQPI